MLLAMTVAGRNRPKLSNSLRGLDQPRAGAGGGEQFTVLGHQSSLDEGDVLPSWVTVASPTSGPGFAGTRNSRSW